MGLGHSCSACRRSSPSEDELVSCGTGRVGVVFLCVAGISVADPGCGERGGGAPIHPSQACGGWVTQ